MTIHLTTVAAESLVALHAYPDGPEKAPPWVEVMTSSSSRRWVQKDKLVSWTEINDA